MSTIAENNKRIARNTLLLYFRMAFSMLVSLYTSRVVLNALGVDDYGTYNVVGGVVVMFSFFNAALSISTQRFMSYDMGRNDPVMLRTTFSMAFALHLGLAILILCLAETVGLWFLQNKMVFPAGRMEAVLCVYQLSVVTCMLSVTQIPYTAALNAHERMNIYAYTSIVEESFKLMVALVLQWVSCDKLIAYAWLLFATNASMLAFYRYYCATRFAECRVKWKRWNIKRLKEMGSLSGWNTTIHFANTARTEGVNIVLNLFFGTAINAARGIGVSVFWAVTGFVNNFIWAMNPQMVKYYAAQNYAAMQQLIVKGSKFAYFLLFILALPLITETDFVLTLWLKAPPVLASTFCRLILVSALIETLSTLTVYGILASGRVKRYTTAMSLVLLLIPVLSYVAYKWWHAPAIFCIYAEMLGYVVALILRPLCARRAFPFSLRSFYVQSVSPAIAVSLLAIIPPLIIVHTMPAGWTRFFINCVVCEACSLSLIAFIGMNSSERQKVILWIKRKLSSHTAYLR